MPPTPIGIPAPINPSSTPHQPLINPSSGPINSPSTPHQPLHRPLHRPLHPASPSSLSISLSISLPSAPLSGAHCPITARAEPFFPRLSFVSPLPSLVTL